ncbi:MAG TPA: HAMP domain-containing sensor histidine kinase [Gemmataceae bacterium]|jgi:signal transduction histidine kinase|nr:HAMP domain-containing sensor histidine kinase [Gemmataceae bacterium]
MNRWLQRLSLFLLIALLVDGGLGWATSEALRLEKHQRQAAADAERAEQISLALWRLDGWMAPQLAREDGRPYAHYSALHAPIPAMDQAGLCAPGTVRVPSPLLDAPLPEWMLLHFQYSPDNKRTNNWQSPEVLPEKIVDRLRKPPFRLLLSNVTPERASLLKEMLEHFSPNLLAQVQSRSILPPETDLVVEMTNNASNPTPNFTINQPPFNSQQPGNPNSMRQAQTRNGSYNDGNNAYNRGQNDNSEAAKRAQIIVPNSPQQQLPVQNTVDPDFDLDAITATNGLSPQVQTVRVGSMVPVWMPSPEKAERLLYARLAKVGSKEVIQGIVIDWPELEAQLRDMIADLFPEARLLPLPDGPPAHRDRVTSALPVELDPGPMPPLPKAGWTPLRIGLCLAWAAALLALLAVGLGGWSLVDLSERRIRFVSAVTHELRTPMTTLRLYLDMLTSGMVREEAQKQEYLQTLQGESERLHRLIGNVLDFARLEKQGTKVEPKEVAVSDLIETIRSTWQERCQTCGKELIIENRLLAEAKLITDSALVQQIIGNLIDNACKYSRDAADKRIWLRAQPSGASRLIFEVEDCGPGVKAGEKRSIFRPFRRGCDAEVIAGGVGLGLALARRWAGMLGGKVEYRKGECAGGACFRLELPSGR